MDLLTPRRWLLNSSPLWVLQLLVCYGLGVITGGLCLLGIWMGITGQVAQPAFFPYLVVATVAVWILGNVGMLFLCQRLRRSRIVE